LTIESQAQGFALAEAARAAGFQLRTFEAIGSTNDAALDLVAAGASANRTWIVAHAQTKGRGRHGRQWQSPPGNLYSSLLLIDEVTPRAAPQLGFVAGVALARALRRLSPDGSRIRLKWPNDILLDDAKLAGILAEGRALAQGYAAVIGLGVNCKSCPPDLPYRAAAFIDTGAARHKAEDVFLLLSEEMTNWLGFFQQGFDVIRAEWLRLAAGIGGEIRVTTTTRQFEGTFESIDADGRLMLRDAQGVHVIEAGDVILGH
jgi:BirA family transcriptional regulator, biotin operon repressor / biotin---[acetyl-CoA-carboxylase] ligase